MDAIPYLYGFKAGVSRAGAQYLRLNMAFPNHFTADDIVKRNKNSIMIPGQQSLLKANSQSVNPTTIGWLLRSNHTMADYQELEQVLRSLWEVNGGFGLYWATVRDGDAYDPQNTARAIHIETEEETAARLTTLAEKAYGKHSNQVEEYPLGISMMFVQPYNTVAAPAKGIVKQYVAYQKTNETMIKLASWFGEVALDRSIKMDRFESLHFWLMSLTSIKKTKKKMALHTVISCSPAYKGHQISKKLVSTFIW
jgi:hypothetical protein